MSKTKSSLMQKVTRLNLSLKTVLQMYPPFFFMGVKIVELAPDYRRMLVRLPLRWYSRNLHGTMFGGYLCAVSDPMAALLCSKIIDGVEVWTKAHCVEFIRPATTDVHLEVTIAEHDIKVVTEQLSKAGKTTHTFEHSFRDRHGHEVAKVKNTVFFRRKAASHTGHTG